MSQSQDSLVSIIIPCFNQGKFLSATLDSVISQTCDYWECLIIDDGSTDSTKEVALDWAKRDTRFHYTKKENRGLCSARNLGLSMASGKYIQFLDSDDLIEKEKLRRQTIYLEDDPRVDIVVSDAAYFDTANSNVLRPTMLTDSKARMREFLDERELLRILIDGNIMPVNAPLIRSERCRSVGTFDENLTALEDWDFWLRCLLQGSRARSLFVEGTRALVRVHSASMTQNESNYPFRQVESRKKIWNSDSPNLGQEARARNARILARELVMEAKVGFRRGNLRIAASKLAQAIYYSPGIIFDLLKKKTGFVDELR